MGCFALLVHLGACIIYFIAAKQTLKWFEAGELDIPVIIIGMLISLLILMVLGLSYYVKEKVYALSPWFKIPFYLIYFPGILGLILYHISFSTTEGSIQSILVSIVFSGFLMVFLGKYIYGILDYLDIPKYY